jgi:hypothetical protein
MSEDNVVSIGGVTKLDLSPDKVLTAATGIGMEAAIVVGMDADGKFYFASSVSDCMEVSFLLDAGRDFLMREWWKRQRGES